jgi:uncharacterized protein YacL
VDHVLIRLAASQDLRILTTDTNLDKVANIQGVSVLNVNDLGNMLRPQAIAGDTLVVDISKRGEAPAQGVGYLPDGTMVVVEDASERVGETVDVIVTNALQTSAGRMIFARRIDAPAGDPEHIAEAATHQPRMTAAPLRPARGTSRRNPRR